MRELFGWVESGQVRPVIDAVFPLTDGIAAIKKVTGRDVMGKVIVKP